MLCLCASAPNALPRSPMPPRCHALHQVRFIDPTYMIRTTPCNALDHIYARILAHNAVDAGFSGGCRFLGGSWGATGGYMALCTAGGTRVAPCVCYLAHIQRSGRSLQRWVLVSLAAVTIGGYGSVQGMQGAHVLHC